MNYRTKPISTAPWMIVDIETIGRNDVSHLLEAPEASKALKDPAKIAADIEAKTIERDGKLALDMNCAQIVAIGYMTEWMESPAVLAFAECENDHLAFAWNLLYGGGAQEIIKRRLIGFHIRSYDVPVMIQRTRLLGMPEPDLDYSRYSKDITDLAEVLACGDPKFAGYSAMRRTLKNYCAAFGTPDRGEDCDGADVGALVAAGDYDAVREHCAADVWRTYDLAVRLGVIAGSEQ